MTTTFWYSSSAWARERADSWTSRRVCKVFTVREMQEVLKPLSLRTVHRVLAAMVRDGVIEKIGQRTGRYRSNR